MKGLLDYTVNVLGIHHFIAHCDSENVASYKVMEKLGMVLEPIIGVVVWAVYCAGVQLYAAVKGKEAVKKKQKAIYIPVCVMDGYVGGYV